MPRYTMVYRACPCDRWRRSVDLAITILRIESLVDISSNLLITFPSIISRVLIFLFNLIYDIYEVKSSEKRHFVPI